MSAFTYHSQSRPCPVCGAKTNCRTSDGGLHFCRYRHGDDDTPGFLWAGESKDGLWGMWVEEGAATGPRPCRCHPPKLIVPPTRSAKPAGPSRFERARAASRCLSAGEAAALAGSLGLPPDVVERHFDRLEDDGFQRPCWTVPEWGFDAAGNLRTVSLLFRYDDGRKVNHGDPGVPVRRGLTLPDGWADREGPVYVPEGASDALALSAMGLCAVGRPSSRGGADTLAELLARTPGKEGREVIILGENDLKPDGRWEGRDGAWAFARRLADLLGRPVRVGMPPEGSKDAREWFVANWRRGSDPTRLAELFGGIVRSLVRVFRPEQPQTPDEALAAATAPALSGEGLRQIVADVLAGRAEQEKAEAVAARNISGMLYDQEAYRCPAPRELIFSHRQTHEPIVGFRRCGHYRCGGCKRYLVERELHNAELRFALAGQLYEAESCEDAWGADYRRINRAGGDYLRVRNGDTWLVWTDRPVAGALPVRPEEALGTLRHLLECYGGDERPVSTSHPWGLPEEDATSCYELIGEAEGVTRQDADRVAAEFGATVQSSGRRSGPGPFVRWWRFKREQEWTGRDAERLAAALSGAGGLPDVPDVEYVFPDGSSTLADDLAVT